MTKAKAIYLLRNTAWLAPSGTLEQVEEAVETAIDALIAMGNAHNPVQHVGSVELISREDAMDILDDFQKDIENGVDSYGEHRDRLLSLPGPVGNSDTLRPKGKWIVNRYDSRGVCCCNNCFGQFVHVPMDGGEVPWNFCPNCGSRMRKGEER